MDSISSSLSTLSCPLCKNRNLLMAYSYESAEYLHCASCDLFFVNPMPSEAAMIARAEYWAQKYHTTPQKVLQHYTAEFQEVAFGEHIHLLQAFRKTNDLLDLGCGIGGFLSAAQSAGWNAIGVDVSSSAQVAKEHGLQVFQSSLDEIDFEENRFDVIAMLDVIEHLPKPERILKEVLRFLRPGGCIYLITPNAGGLLAHLLKERWEAVEPLDHVMLYNSSSMKYLLESSGFTKIRNWAIDLNFVALLNSFSPQSPRDDAQRQNSQKSRRLFINKFVQSSVLRLLRKYTNRILMPLLIGDKLISIAQKPAGSGSQVREEAASLVN